MVSKKSTPVKKGVGKLKLKKETVRDLDPKGKAGGVKGGQPPVKVGDSVRYCETDVCRSMVVC